MENDGSVYRRITGEHINGISVGNGGGLFSIILGSGNGRLDSICTFHE